MYTGCSRTQKDVILVGRDLIGVGVGRDIKIVNKNKAARMRHFNFGAKPAKHEARRTNKNN